MGINHNFVSTKSDGSDASLVRPSDWNDDHVGGVSAQDISVNIPGLAGSPDQIPSSPSAFDDEFDTTSTFTSVLGTLDTNNTTDVSSHLHILKTASGAFQLHGVYKAIPSMPFTVTMKLVEQSWDATYQRFGLMLLESGPGKIFEYGTMYWSAGQPNLGYGIWASRTSRTSFSDASTIATWGNSPLYLRLIVTSSTSVTRQISKNGFVYNTIGTAINPGFTIASVGLVVTGEDTSLTIDGYCDWVRFS